MQLRCWDREVAAQLRVERGRAGQSRVSTEPHPPPEGVVCIPTEGTHGWPSQKRQPGARGLGRGSVCCSGCFGGCTGAKQGPDHKAPWLRGGGGVLPPEAGRQMKAGSWSPVCDQEPQSKGRTADSSPASAWDRACVCLPEDGCDLL